MKWSSKEVMKKFGLTRNEFRSEYEVFRRRVQKFNQYTGANYSPLAEYRYSKINPKNPTIQAIQSISSNLKSIGRNTINIAKTYLKERYSGLIANSPTLAQKYEQIGQNGYSTTDFDADARQYAEDLKKARKEDPLISSSAIDSAVSADLVSSNDDYINVKVLEDKSY